MDKVEIKIGSDVVDLNPADLNFDQATLSDYLIKEGQFYSYYGQKLAEAEALLQTKELQYDSKLSEKMVFLKDNGGGSDPIVKAKAQVDPEIVAAKEACIAAKLKVRRLQHYIRAWDKNHENAISYGYSLRKEIDKLCGNSIKVSSDYNDIEGLMVSDLNKD